MWIIPSNAEHDPRVTSMRDVDLTTRNGDKARGGLEYSKLKKCGAQVEYQLKPSC